MEKTINRLNNQIKSLRETTKLEKNFYNDSTIQKNEEAEKLREKIISLNSKVDNLTNCLSDKEHISQQLCHMVDSDKANYNKTLQNLENEMERLKNEISNNQTFFDGEINLKNYEIQDLKEKSSHLVHKLSGFENSMTEKNNELGYYKCKVNELKNC